MELERCSILLSVIETGSFSTAASQLGYTTSGISRMMAALEKEVGVALLFRTHDGVHPTPECEILLPSIREFIFAGETCLQLSAKMRGLDIGTVTIGTAYSAYYDNLSSSVAAFCKKYPQIKIQFKDGNSSELMMLLNTHEIDLCIISKREGVCKWLPLCEDEVVAWIPANHPLAQAKEVPLSVFTTEPYIDIFPGQESDNSRIFERYQIQPNTQFTTSDSHCAYAMVEAGLGIALNNSINGKNRSGSVKILPLSPRQKIQIGIATAKETSPAVETFIKHLINQYL